MDFARASIRRAVELGRGRFWFMLKLALAIFVPLGLLGTLDALYVQGADAPENFERVVAAAIISSTTLIGTLVYAGAVASALVHAGPDFEPTFRWVLRTTRWRTIIAIDIIFSIAVVIGLLLLIVPGILLYARWVLAAPIADIDRIGIRAAFRRSTAESKGHRLAIVSMLFALTTATGVLQSGISSLADDLGSTFAVEWIASLISQIAVDPPYALLAVAFVLEIRHRRGAPAVADG